MIHITGGVYPEHAGCYRHFMRHRQDQIPSHFVHNSVRITYRQIADNGAVPIDAEVTGIVHHRHISAGAFQHPAYDASARPADDNRMPAFISARILFSVSSRETLHCTCFIFLCPFSFYP